MSRRANLRAAGRPGNVIQRMVKKDMNLTMLAHQLRFFLAGLVHDEEGQDLVEYALIVAAVGLALITTVNQLTTVVVSLYQSITQGLTSIGATGA